MLERASIVTVSIYRSTPFAIKKYASASISPDVVALSDREGAVYTSYQVKQSTFAVFLSGPTHVAKNFRKYKPHMNLRGMMVGVSEKSAPHKQLPADFLINEDGVIVDLFRAETVSDHMPFERVEAFIPEGKRCRCNKQDCVSPRCRKEYTNIRRQSIIYTGPAGDGIRLPM